MKSRTMAIWLVFDGTNLKRRYTLIVGRQPSAPTFPYAAFELRFESRNVFIGTENSANAKCATSAWRMALCPDPGVGQLTQFMQNYY